MTTVIAIANHKGGSGKTTSTYYLGLALAAQGLGTMLIDLDDQATLTARLRSKFSDYGTHYTIADVMDGEELKSALNVLDGNLSYIASDHRLAWAAAKLQASSPNHAFLRRALERRKDMGRIDYVLLDCPPSAGVIMINALAAADYVVIPATPTIESFQGLQRMRLMIDELASILGHDVQELGNIITMESPSSLSERQYRDLMSCGCLGIVPRRVGADADRILTHMYANIADSMHATVRAICSAG